MATVRIDAAAFAQLKLDAALTRTIRAARLDGAVPSLSRPTQHITIDIDGSKVTPIPDWQNHRDAIQLAFTACLTAGPTTVVADTPITQETA
jgi:hypothetical protein